MWGGFHSVQSHQHCFQQQQQEVALSKGALITAVAYLPGTKWQADKLT